MKSALIGFSVLAAGFSGITQAALMDGVETDAEPRISQIELAEMEVNTRTPRLSATVINFDDFLAPTGFSVADSLSDEYAHLGVTFSGPSPVDGGAILNAISFAVTGHSLPNILAFSSVSSLSNGGDPFPPETITFDQPQSSVQINAGSSSPGTEVVLVCYDANAAFLGADAFVLTSAMQTLSVDSPGIVTCRVDTASRVLVLDDLAFSSGPTANQITIDNGYIKLDTTHGMAPVDADCATFDHYGRMAVDDIDGTLYVCAQTGWVPK